MDKIAYPAPVNKSEFAPSKTDRAIKYGLPGKVTFCKRCVISNQRPISAVEYQHTKDTKKKTIHFGEEEHLRCLPLRRAQEPGYRLGRARARLDRVVRQAPQQERQL